MAEANPGHSDRDAILQALLPGPRYGSTLGPGKARIPFGEHRPMIPLLVSKTVINLMGAEKVSDYTAGPDRRAQRRHTENEAQGMKNTS